MVKSAVAVLVAVLVILAIAVAIPSHKSHDFDDCMRKVDDYSQEISNAALRNYVQTIAKERMAEEMNK